MPAQANLAEDPRIPWSMFSRDQIFRMEKQVRETLWIQQVNREVLT